MRTIEFAVMVIYSTAPVRVQPVLDEQRIARHSKTEHEVDHSDEGKTGKRRRRRCPDRIGKRSPQLPEQIEQRHDRDQRGVLEQRNETVDETWNDVAQRLRR